MAQTTRIFAESKHYYDIHRPPHQLTNTVQQRISVSVSVSLCVPQVFSLCSHMNDQAWVVWLRKHKLNQVLFLARKKKSCLIATQEQCIILLIVNTRTANSKSTVIWSKQHQERRRPIQGQTELRIGRWCDNRRVYEKCLDSASIRVICAVCVHVFRVFLAVPRLTSMRTNLQLKSGIG